MLPAFELVTEPLPLIELPLGVLAGVMKGEKPPPAIQHAFDSYRLEATVSSSRTNSSV